MITSPTADKEAVKFVSD